MRRHLQTKVAATTKATIATIKGVIDIAKDTIIVGWERRWANEEADVEATRDCYIQCCRGFYLVGWIKGQRAGWGWGWGDT